MAHLKQNIISLAKGSSRNKILISSKELPGIEVLDVGKELAQIISNLNDKTNLSLKITITLEKLFDQYVSNDKIIGSALQIKNIGILLEPELKIDHHYLFDKYSKNNLLIILWGGGVSESKLIFSEKSRHFINLENLSFIID